MKKAIIFAVLIILLLTAFPASVFAAREGWIDFEDVQIGSYCVIDADTGQVILEKDADRRRANASTTKIMTALLLLEDSHFDPDRLLTVSGQSLYFMDPNSARIKGLNEGDLLKTIDCLAALLIASANDIARVIAQNYGGAYGAVDQERRNDASYSQELFVARMNERAQELGAVNTHFTNPAGFDEADQSHYTTARDIALIAAEAMKHPLIAHICSMRYYRMPVNSQHEEAWWGTMGNSNALVIYGKDYFESRYYERYTGVKTGTTPQAGMCLVGSGDTNDGRHFICAALGIVPAPISSSPFLARAIPVSAVMEEAARIMGVPEKEPQDLLAIPIVENELPAPLETEPEPEPEPTTEYLPDPSIGEDVFFTGGIGQTKPSILILAAVGLLAVIGAIVAGIIALLIYVKKHRKNVFEARDKSRKER